MFNNACFFRVAEGFELPPLELLEPVLQKARFISCGPTQPESSGWVPPRPKSTLLSELVNGQLILKLATERRSVPASAIKDAVEQKVARYKQETGNERVPSKLKKEFKEEALLDLLPRAFTKKSTTMLWLDPKNRMLVVDAPSLAGADRIVSSILAALVEIGCASDPSDPMGRRTDIDLQMVQTQSSPSASMAHWLSIKEAPWRFTVDRECELKACDEQKSSVRYSHHTLEIDEVPQHIAAGKMPTKLAMTWNDRVSFVLTEGGQLRKIKLLDVVGVDAADSKDEGDDKFSTDTAIFTGELAALLPDLILALGGEVEESAA